MAKLGQKAFREKQGLKTAEDISNYFKELRKKRKNYKKKSKVEAILPIDNGKPLV